MSNEKLTPWPDRRKHDWWLIASFTVGPAFLVLQIVLMLRHVRH